MAFLADRLQKYFPVQTSENYIIHITFLPNRSFGTGSIFFNFTAIASFLLFGALLIDTMPPIFFVKRFSKEMRISL
jgi:hypothetical protein